MGDTQDPLDPGEDMPTLERINGSALGLLIIARKSKGWPEGRELSLK